MKDLMHERMNIDNGLSSNVIDSERKWLIDRAVKFKKFLT